VGLIQFAIEKEGIPTISITHLADLTKKIRVSRSLHLRFPLGRSFGRADDQQMQRQILLDAIHYLREINVSETMIKLPYKWKGKKGNES
jgi:D-proline reductase (dithiol) PrdB